MVFKNIMVRNVKPYCLNSLLSNLKYYNRSSEYYNKVAFKIEPGNRVLVLLITFSLNRFRFLPLEPSPPSFYLCLPSFRESLGRAPKDLQDFVWIWGRRKAPVAGSLKRFGKTDRPGESVGVLCDARTRSGCVG